MFTDLPEGQTQSDQHEHDGVVSPVPRIHCLTCLQQKLRIVHASYQEEIDLLVKECLEKNFGSAESA